MVDEKRTCPKCRERGVESEVTVKDNVAVCTVCDWTENDESAGLTLPF